MTSARPCGIIFEQSARTAEHKVNIAGWSSLVARRAHNPKVVGSNPAPATTKRSEISQNAFFVVCIRYEEGAAAHRFSRKCSSPSYCIKNLHPLAAEMVAAHKACQIEGLAGGCARSMMAAKSYCVAVLFLYLPFTICRPPRHGRARREQGSLVSGSRAGCRPGG